MRSRETDFLISKNSRCLKVPLVFIVRSIRRQIGPQHLLHSWFADMLMSRCRAHPINIFPSWFFWLSKTWLFPSAPSDSDLVSVTSWAWLFILHKTSKITTSNWNPTTHTFTSWHQIPISSQITAGFTSPRLPRVSHLWCWCGAVPPVVPVAPGSPAKARPPATPERRWERCHWYLGIRLENLWDNLWDILWLTIGSSCSLIAHGWLIEDG